MLSPVTGSAFHLRALFRPNMVHSCSLLQALHSASSERDLIKSSLANTEAQLRTAHAQLSGFRDERERLTAAHTALKAKLASEREASRMQSLETQRATASVKRLEAELDEASKRLTLAEGERTQHEALVREMREQAERSREQLDETRVALAAETEARQTEASAREQAVAAYEEERDGRQTCIRSQHEMEKSQRRIEDLLREREADVSQLKALVARMELAHSELAAKLESAQVRLADAQSGKSTETEKRERLAAELRDAKQALASLRELVGSLDRERDALASQVKRALDFPCFRPFLAVCQSIGRALSDDPLLFGRLTRKLKRRQRYGIKRTRR